MSDPSQCLCSFVFGLEAAQVEMVGIWRSHGYALGTQSRHRANWTIVQEEGSQHFCLFLKFCALSLPSVPSQLLFDFASTLQTSRLSLYTVIPAASESHTVFFLSRCVECSLTACGRRCDSRSGRAPLSMISGLRLHCSVNTSQ